MQTVLCPLPRRVTYTVPVYGEPGRYLLVTFATPGSGDPAGTHADLLAELFDAIMSTFRWDIGQMEDDPQ